LVSVVHQWNPDDWEVFALSLLQWRHGHLEIHKVPSTHKGDLGIDFYCTTEAVIYQCYAVEEPVDILTRAERQKSKITSDLKKMIDGAPEVFKLFLSKPIKKWILLAPLHDSKDVNFHCAKKTTDLRAEKHFHLHPDFEVCIHDQSVFPGVALNDAIATLTNLYLSVAPPTKEELDAWQAGSPNLLANATSKLAKRAEPATLQTVVANSVEYFLKGNALIDALRTSAPDLHEKVAAAISGRARRLAFVGPQGGPAPTTILNTELDNLIDAIKAGAPSLSQVNAEEIALGTISEWIMRCPLDFPTDAS
jgi:hypothetical protein